MCGIFGYIGKDDPLSVCLRGLKLLEYRGYDSTGISGIHKGKIVLYKKSGKLSSLQKEIQLPKLDLAIAHTRWATHGIVNDQNAHPHVSSDQSISLVHNGIVENYKELKNTLLAEGYTFTSDTDTEVVVNLISKHYDGCLTEALHQTISQLRGLFSFVVIHKDHPDQIIVTARDCPLSIGINSEKTASVISSDPNTFQGSNFDVLFLKDNEIAQVKLGSVEVFDRDLHPIQKPMEHLLVENKAPTKEGFEHFMLKEIFEQPASIRRALLGRYQGKVQFDELKLSEDFLHSIRHLWILGCGTSFHASHIASLLMEDLAQFPASAEISSEARYRAPLLSAQTLVMAVSQSGETADTLAAVRAAQKYGCLTMGICNVIHSTLSREADGIVHLKAGPEISVCSTKAFTSQLAVFMLLSLYFGQITKKISPNKVAAIYAEMIQIPGQIQKILDQKDQIHAIAKKYARYKNFFFLGRRYMLPTCKEAALKLKEISYVNANGYPAGELKHGPIALLDTEFPVIAFCANERTREKIISNLAEVKARGAPVFAIAPEGYDELESIADDIFYTPKSSDILAPFTSSVVGQLFAYYIALEKGLDIDQPRNLAKSVTVE